MIKIKHILVIIPLIALAAVLTSVGLATPAYADGETWRWNGSDIAVWGGHFGNDENSAVIFTSDKGSTTFSQSTPSPGQPPGSEGFYGSKKTNTSPSVGGADKDYYQSYKRDDCLLQTDVKIEVDRGARKVTVKVQNKYISSDDKGHTKYVGEGVTSTDGKECYVRDTISFDTVLHGEPGKSAEETNQADALNKLRDEKRKEFLDKECPLAANPTTEQERENLACRIQAGKAFDGYWQNCAARASVVPAGRQKEAKINECLQETAGIGIEEGSTDGFTIADYEKEPVSCDIKGIGYIICPLMRFMGSLADAAWNVVKEFLTIKPLDTGSSGGAATYNAWKTLRDIANVAFIVTLLIIVISQVTGGGFSNYNIKRLLPRIIVAALLMNSSYFLCVIAIDLSNIIGDSLQTVLSSLSPNSAYGQGNTISNWSSVLGLGGGILTFAGIGAVLIYATLAAAVPLLTSVLIALSVTALVLVARYALIIMLVVIAPLAFVAYLLPNTQKWFDKWLSTFIVMLMLYPMVALLYGGSSLAADTVLASSTARGSSVGQASQITALAIQALPLILTPFLIKFAGGILKRFGAAVSSTGPLSKIQKKSDEFAATRKTEHDMRALNHFGPNKRKGLRGIRDKVVQNKYARQAAREGLEGEKGHAEAEYVRKYMSGEAGSGGDKATLNPLQRLKGNDTKAEAYLDSMSKGGSKVDALNHAAQAKLSAHVEEVNAAKTRILHASGASFEGIKDMAKNGEGLSSVEREAAIELTLEQGEVSDLSELLKASEQRSPSDQRDPNWVNMTTDHRAKLTQAMQRSSGAPHMIDPDAQNNVMQGRVSSENFAQTVVAPSVMSGDFSAANITGLHPAAAAELSGALSELSGSADPALAAAVQDVRAAARQAIDNSHTSNAIIGSALPHIENIARG
ncbi:hypothetical protein I8H83_05630 [Candidatus Saccharibacteria bacterium]|nr:hypothetical protein [Candidatus Saccharibacteria bacterium]